MFLQIFPIFVWCKLTVITNIGNSKCLYSVDNYTSNKGWLTGSLMLFFSVYLVVTLDLLMLLDKLNIRTLENQDVRCAGCFQLVHIIELSLLCLTSLISFCYIYCNICFWSECCLAPTQKCFIYIMARIG